MNSNKDFTGFTPEELAESTQQMKEDAAAELSKSADTLKELLENEDIKESLAEQGYEVNKEKFDEFYGAAKSPESGQWMSPELIETAKQNTQITPPKKHKKPKKWKDIGFKGLVTQDVAPAGVEQSGDYLTAADIKKAAEKLKNVSVKPKDGYYYSYGFPNTAVTTTPNTVPSPWVSGAGQTFTYTTPFYGVDWSGLPVQLEAYQKEITWLKTQLAESKEVIKQLSGETGEFIYIHPFDLYELLNSFVIPVVMNVEKEFSDCGYIEINGKKYKQSTLMPIKSKNSFVDASKYSDPGIKPEKPKAFDWAYCDVCDETKTGHLCDKHLPNPNTELPMTKFEKEYPW